MRRVQAVALRRRQGVAKMMPKICAIAGQRADPGAVYRQFVIPTRSEQWALYAATARWDCFPGDLTFLKSVDRAERCRGHGCRELFLVTRKKRISCAHLIGSPSDSFMYFGAPYFRIFNSC